ncbi:MAG: class I SAM-dependent methyltransferase [Dongiaceae bacterium]
MATADSKALWLGLRSKLAQYDVRLGTATAQDYIHDPKHIVFVASRYKFAAKMVAGLGRVMEVGCGDAFGAPIIAQGVGQLICTDIDEETLKDNAVRCAPFTNISFEYFDFRERAYPEQVDAICLVDVLEHVYPAEEPVFLANLAKTLTSHGVALFGTPNITAEGYSSPNSRLGHVNLKDHKTLRACLAPHFHNIFLFSMNDEVLHTGYYPMAHYLWALCAGPRRP